MRVRRTFTHYGGLSLKGREPVTVYFADSYSSWQKEDIENANKLIRKYIPKKANFNDLSDKMIHNVQVKLNRRPREKINFDSPKKRFFSLISLFCICCWTLQILIFLLLNINFLYFSLQIII